MSGSKFLWTLGNITKLWSRNMNGVKLVTHCGLYCGLCAQLNRVPIQAQALRDSMDKEGYPFWGNEIPNFGTFWKFLCDLSEVKEHQNCRSGNCGYPPCQIRKCAQEKKIDFCPFCDEYPCDLISDFARVYPTLIADGNRMKEIGIELWVKEQEVRRNTGFVYADIRCRTCDI